MSPIDLHQPNRYRLRGGLTERVGQLLSEGRGALLDVVDGLGLRVFEQRHQAYGMDESVMLVRFATPGPA